MDERVELRFIILECGDGVGVAVHVAGPAFHASKFEERVEVVLAHGGADQQESRRGLSMTYICFDWMADPRSGQSIILYCM